MTSNSNNAPGFPIKQFVRIDAADVTDATNILIVELNSLFTSLGAGVVPAVTQKQVRNWLAANNYIYTIDQAVPADIGNVVNIAWDHGNTMLFGDVLYQFIQTTLGFNNLQMMSAFAQMQELQS